MMGKVKIFLTVGNANQEKLCRKLISASGILNERDISIVCDSEDSIRIGSGGAFLNILNRYYDSGDKMIVINSGGFSKRSMNYALKGKAFAAFQSEEKETFLLSKLIENGESFFKNYGSGILVCCGDILFDVSRVNAPKDENILFSVYSDKQKATRHGIFFKDGENRFEAYLHKGTSEQVEEFSAKYNGDKILIDTGFAFFASKTLVSLKNGIAEIGLLDIVEEASQLNLYSDIICCLSKYPELSQEGAPKSKVKNTFLNMLHNESAYICVDEKQSFIHFGTHKECIENVIGLSGENPSIINSRISSDSVIGNGSFVENSILNSCKVGEGCCVSDITLNNKKIEKNKAVCGIKLNDGDFVTIIFDTNANPKDNVKGVEIWQTPLFARGRSFDESFSLFHKEKGERVSAEYCICNADYSYCYDNFKFINDMNSSTVCEEYYSMRSSVIDAYFKNSSYMSECICRCDFAEINLPVRVNLSGTWTDAVPYCVLYGGSVINMAVTVDGELPIKVIAEKTNRDKIEFCSDGYCSDYDFESENSYEESDFLLHKAALKIFGISKKTVIKNGFKLSTYVNGLDKGSGLGVSSILLSGCLLALARLFGKPINKSEIIKQVFVAEQLMKTGGGWQDQVGGIFPSIKICSSQGGAIQDVSVNRLELKENIKKIIENRAVLVPTSQRHFGRFIVADVARRCINKESLDVMNAIKCLNDRFIDSIDNDDYLKFFECINLHFSLLKQISPLITNSTIEVITSKLNEYCNAVSICGAGGGGYMLAILKENVSAEMLQEDLEKSINQNNSKIKKLNIYEQEQVQ